MIALDLVIVTYNRLEKLKKTIQHYENQTVSFRNLIIVNNCSTDGTNDFLHSLPSYLGRENHKTCDIVIIDSKENIGGSGGFYLGQKEAVKRNADRVFVADDDAYADPYMIEEFYTFIETHDTGKIAAVCAKVLNMDGSICLNHRDRYKVQKDKSNPFCHQFVRETSKEHDYEKDFFLVDILSYVGSFLNTKVLKKAGLVNPKYFIYLDDSEHSIRIGHYGDIMVVPKLKIFHDSGADTMLANQNVILSWRAYYLTRNHYHMLLKHFPRCVIKEYVNQFRRTVGAWIHRSYVNEFELLERSAMWDAFWGRLGKHPLYKPGWNIEKEKTS